MIKDSIYTWNKITIKKAHKNANSVGNIGMLYSNLHIHTHTRAHTHTKGKYNYFSKKQHENLSTISIIWMNDVWYQVGEAEGRREETKATDGRQDQRN